MGILDPYTGEILALAQYPFFHPADYQKYFNDVELTEHTKVKAITDANEPGSVFKPFTIAVALKANQQLQKQGEKELFYDLSRKFLQAMDASQDAQSLSQIQVCTILNLDMAMQVLKYFYGTFG